MYILPLFDMYMNKSIEFFQLHQSHSGDVISVDILNAIFTSNMILQLEQYMYILLIVYIFVQVNYNNNYYFFYYFSIYFSSFIYVLIVKLIYSAVYFMFSIENNVYIYIHRRCYYILLNICHKTQLPYSLTFLFVLVICFFLD